MRVRVRYSKAGKLRFVSAIDLGRIWERALRRAHLPIAYSEGFSPHAKVSFPDALPLGYASTGEYAELTFAAPIQLVPAIAALNTAFPQGLDVTDCVEVADGDPRLAKWLPASYWTIDYSVDTPELAQGLGAGLTAAAAELLAASDLPVQRVRKDEPVTVDLRPAVFAVWVEATTVHTILHHPGAPNTNVVVAVRPSEVHLALSDFCPGLPAPVLVTRAAQGQPIDGGLTEALSGAHHAPAVAAKNSIT